MPDELKPDTGGLGYLKPETGEPTGLPARERIAPALTAAEWAKGETWLHNRLQMRDTTVRPTPDGRLEVTVYEHPSGAASLTIPPQLRAGVAALALHGQPFGFTPRMLEALHLLADAYTPLREPECAEMLKELRAVRDRVAALLPPDA